MNKFLKGNMMDGFTVLGVELFCTARFRTDGRINPRFLGENEKRTFCRWEELRPYIYGLVKGSIKPEYFRAVLALGGKKAEQIHRNAASLHLTIYFERDIITFTAGTAQKNFSLKGGEDAAWEDHLKTFFRKNGFVCETPV